MLIRLTSLFYFLEDGIFRLGDIENDEIKPFYVEDYVKNSYTDRRKWPFPESGSVGTVICKEWTTRNMDKDIVESYNVNIQPIEIIRCIHNDIEKLGSELGRSIPLLKANKERSVFYIGAKNSAILCTKDDVELGNDGKLRIKSSILKLPIYELKQSEIVALEIPKRAGGVRYFYKYVGAFNKEKKGDVSTISTERKVVHKSEVISLIKEKILTSRKLKDEGLTRSTTQLFKTVFERLSKSILDVATFAQQHGISDEEVSGNIQKIFQSYIEELEGFVQMDEQILASVLEKKPSIDAKFMNLWMQMRSKELKDKEAEFDKAIKQLKLNHDKEIEQLSLLKDDLIGINEEIREKKIEEEMICKRIEDLEKQEKEKGEFLELLEDELKNLTENPKVFAAKQLLSTIFPCSHVGIVEQPKESKPDFSDLYVKGHVINEEYMEDSFDVAWEYNSDFLSGEASTKKMIGSFFEASYEMRQSLIFAGVAGIELANAIAASCSGREADCLSCHGAFDETTFNNAIQGEDGILIIKGGINSSWTDEILLRLNRIKKQVIFLLPLEDDLYITPRGIFSYAIPLCIDIIVKSVRAYYENNIIGAKKTKKVALKHGKSLKKFSSFSLPLGLEYLCTQYFSKPDENLFIQEWMYYSYAYATSQLKTLAKENITILQEYMPKED